MDLNLGTGYADTYLEQIFIFNIRINKEDTLKVAFDDLPFWANFRNKDDYLKLIDFGMFHIELLNGRILVDCKLDPDIEYVDKNTDIKGYYSYSRL